MCEYYSTSHIHSGGAFMNTTLNLSIWELLFSSKILQMSFFAVASLIFIRITFLYSVLFFLFTARENYNSYFRATRRIKDCKNNLLYGTRRKFVYASTLYINSPKRLGFHYEAGKFLVKSLLPTALSLLFFFFYWGQFKQFCVNIFNIIMANV